MPFHPPVPPVGAFEPLDLSSFALVPPDFELVGSVQNWRPNWSVIVTGKYSNSPFSDLLCCATSATAQSRASTRQMGRMESNICKSTPAGGNPGHLLFPECLAIPATTDCCYMTNRRDLALFDDTDGQGNLILASAIQIVRAQESIAETQP